LETSEIQGNYKQKIDVFVVDDDDKLLRMISLRLGSKYNVKVAKSGEVALSMIREGYEPDILIVDQVLSDMNGDDFLRRSIQILPNSFRVIISSQYDSEDLITSIHHGNAFICLIKPIKDVELLQGIDYCLRQHRTNLEMEWLESITKPKILIADDSSIILQLMSNLLRSINADIYKANDGLQAVEIFDREQNFDIVILDIIMPKMDGHSVCQKIRETYSIYELPILFLTSLSDSKDIVKGFEVGANDYLLKPFKSEELLARTKTLIKLRKLSQSTTALREVIDTKNNTLKKLQEEINYRAEIEKQLIEEKEKADSANKLKSEFLANMSHEIRTPLNAIIGFSELLKGRVSDAKSNDYLESIVSSGKSLLSLINDILDLSKIEANKIELEYAPFNIESLINEIGGVFKLRAQNKGLDFIVKTEEVNNEYIILDELRLRQVLINLVGNAIKFTDKGFIEINLHYGENAIDNLVDLYIDVIDSGIGIAEDQSEPIFEAFQQHSNQSNKAFGGTGLGLTITKKFVQMMKGTINLESKVGKGSKFTIYIPNVELSCAQQEEVVFKKYLKYEFYSPKILLVDDNENNRKLIIEFLLDCNVRIFEAENGEQAIQSFSTIDPNLVLMDLKMPVMDGFEAIDKIKKLENYSTDIPIIGLTALAFSNDKDKIIEHGFNGYVSKPIQIDELFKEMTKYLPYKSFEVDKLETASETILIDVDIDLLLLRKVLPHLEDLSRVCDEIAKSRKTKQIKDFAAELSDIAIQGKINSLIQYAEKLTAFAMNFDMEGVKKQLSEYRLRVEQLKLLIK